MIFTCISLFVCLIFDKTQCLVVDVLLISILSLNIYPFVEMIKMLNQLIEENLKFNYME